MREHRYINLRLLTLTCTLIVGSAVSACGKTTPSSKALLASTLTTIPATETTSTLPVPPTTAVPAPITMSLAFAGDILIHSQVWKAAAVNAGGSGYDFTPMFARVKPLIEGVDLAICHLEVPLVALGEKPTTNPLYSAPTEIAWAIKEMGFDRCSNASNHTFDKGVKGIEATLNEFDALGLGHAGMARTPEEIEPKVFDVKGIKVARQGFHDYSRGSIVKGTDPRGYDYYWFGLHGMVHTPGHDTDLEVIEDGYIAVTPLQLDLTHNESLANLRSAYSG